MARLDAAETWTDELNPAQLAALAYLSRANRFSRSPSQVAEYLGATRGTVSQTLKALERKGYVHETRSQSDKRSISYELTAAGADAAARRSPLSVALGRLEDSTAAELEDTLSALLSSIIRANGGRPFGVCRTCRHFRRNAEGAFCALLSVPLSASETEKICQEQEPV
ncbi:MarR family winged helix-turn-helix transcriptional regulator [Amorphus orientalis]|uniref:DNA-binding MarR family transcriptional regulator n=1 Tax=Amorphus orientalis TaxID=649198 RepID=A0AAE3VKB4_9HYPH|nr:MarR family transcriptional regulator [Amorphus orientalis]MDQ0313744.1 DNA-binding MarR family transcriptional regulator [Amorphus orientalis]